MRKSNKIVKIIGKITLSEEQKSILARLGVTDIAADNPKSRDDADEIVRRIHDAEAIIVNISTHISKNVMDRCKNLRFIQTWSTGMDNIDLDAAKNAGIIVKNVPSYSTEPVAEKTIGLMIFIANQLREANEDALSGKWNYTQFHGTELKNKTLVIIGGGKIGRRVAELAMAFPMKVLLTNSKTSREELKQLCSQADFITLHCQYNKNTHHLIDEDEFNHMKKGVYIINNSRGGIINEAALLEALNKNIVAYASMDVFEKEPPEKNNPLLHHPRVFVTPHIAWNTHETVKNLTDVCLNELEKYLSRD